MSIISGQKKWVLMGVLAIIIVGGIGAYMFLYPQEEKVSHAVVAPKASPRVAAPVPQPPLAAPKAAVAPVQVIALVAAPSAAPSQIAAPVPPPPATNPVVAAPVATPSVTTPGQALQPPLKLSKSIKTAKAKPERSKSADLRDCLKLETDVAIAKCAGE